MCQGSLPSEQAPHERCMCADILQQRGTVGHMETTVMPNPHHKDLLCQVAYTALLAAQQQTLSQRQSCSSALCACGQRARSVLQGLQREPRRGFRAETLKHAPRQARP